MASCLGTLAALPAIVNTSARKTVLAAESPGGESHAGAAALVVGLGIVLALFALASAREALPSGRWVGALLAWLVTGGVVASVSLLGRTKLLQSDRRLLALVGVLFVVSRLAWVWAVPIEQVSDFRTYHDLAVRLAEAEPLGAVTYNDVLRPWGYPFALAGAYSLVGPRVFVGQMANVVFGLMTLVLLFRLTSAVFGRLAARVAVALMLAWPAQLLFTSVLASEHLGALLGLAAVVCLTPRRDDAGSRWWRFAAAGGLIVAANAVRPPLIILLPIGLVCALANRLPARRRVAAAGALLATFVAGYLSYGVATERVYGASPSRSGAFNALMGTDFEWVGHWNPDDARRFAAHDSLEEANRWAWREAARRVADNPLGFVRLMVRKSLRTWAREEFALVWTLESARQTDPTLVEAVRNWCLSFHLLILVLAALGCLLPRCRVSSAGAAQLAGILLAAVLLHALTEAQDRYHYVFSPLLLACAGAGLAGLVGRHARD